MKGSSPGFYHLFDGDFSIKNGLALEALSLSDDARIVTAATPPYTIVHTNTAWSKITGYKFHEVVGKTPPSCRARRPELPALKELHAALERREPIEVTLVNYQRDGTPYHATISCQLVAGGSHYLGKIAAQPIADGSYAPLSRAPAELARTPLLPVNYADPVQLRARVKAPGARHEGPPPRGPRQQLGPDRALLQGLPPPDHPPEPAVARDVRLHVGGGRGPHKQAPHRRGDRPRRPPLPLGCVKRREPYTGCLINYKKGGKRFVNQVKTCPVYDEDDEVAAFMSMLKEIDDPPPSEAPGSASRGSPSSANPSEAHLWSAIQHRLEVGGEGVGVGGGTR